MAQASFSGSTYSRGSFQLTVNGAFLQRQMRLLLRAKRDRIALADYVHAGIAWVENPLHQRFGSPHVLHREPRYVASMWLWNDTRTCKELCRVFDDADASFKALPQGLDAIASTPAGEFATLLDAAIASARTTPVPQHLPGSYLTEGHEPYGKVHAVWIPSLGASNPI
jgi:hypothetical protein